MSWPEAVPAPRLADESKASVAQLIAALDHVDRDQRVRAEWALVHRGESVIPGLIETMHNEQASRVQRAHALWTLDLIGEQSPELRSQASGLIRQMLKSPDPVVQTQAIRALATRGVKEAAVDLALLAASEHPEVRLQTAIALGRLQAEEVIDLAERLDDPDRWVRFASRVALAKTDLLAPVMQARLDLKEPRPEQAWLALESSYDLEAVNLLSLLAIDSPRALEALGQVAYLPREWDGHWWSTQPVKAALPLNSVPWEGTKIAVTTLTWALEAFETPIRLAAAKALGQFIGPDALPALRRRLGVEKDPAVRRQLIETLGVQKDPEALSVFASIALDEQADPEFRNTAAAAVANIGGEAAKATLTKLVGAELSPAAMLTVVEAISHEHVAEAAPALARRAVAPDPFLRLTALKALNALGAKANATSVYLNALADKDSKVVGAALEALGALHDPATLPALLAYGGRNKGRKEVINALAQFKDPQVIPILVEALGNNNSGARKAALSTLKKMRAESWPKIEERIASGKIPEELVAEIRNTFDSGIIAKWKVLGPFENVWGAVHPPEAEALAAGGRPDLHRRYTTAEAPQIGWREISGNAEDGRVDLGAFFQNQGMVCAYAFTEIVATEAGDATLLCGSDDEIAVWLNGQKVHDNAAERGFVPDTDQVSLHLQKGTNALLVKIGNASGDWVFAGRIPGLDGNRLTPSAEPPTEEKQRAFALATQADGTWLHAGDPAHGEQIFRDPNGPLGGICATCHSVKGQGGQVGPDLGAVAVNYKRPDLITSILEPSKTIALGFEQFAVETNGGEFFYGAIRQETPEATTIVGADAQPHLIKKTEEKERTPVPVSLMPPALTSGLKPQDFADLLAYLETLKGQ